MRKLLMVVLLLSTGASSESTQVKIITYLDYQSIVNTKPKYKKLKLINFWATWCRPCVKEIVDLAKIHKTLGSEIEVNLVSIDSEKMLNQVTETLARKEYNGNAYLLNISDSDFQLIHTNWYGAVPLTLIFNEDNKLIMPIEHQTDYEQIHQIILNRNKN